MNWERVASARRWGRLSAWHPLVRHRLRRVPLGGRSRSGFLPLEQQDRQRGRAGDTVLCPPASGRDFRIRHRVRLDVADLPRAHEVRGGRAGASTTTDRPREARARRPRRPRAPPVPLGPRPDVLRPRHRRWSYTARGPHPGRGKHPETITGTGEDELAAMIDLRIRLDERRRDEKLEEIDRRDARLPRGSRGAVQDGEGRPLTADELERVTKRYPG